MEVSPFIINVKNLLDSAMEKLYDQLQKELKALSDRVDVLESDMDAHIANMNNPHNTTMEKLVLDTQFREPLSSEGKDGDYFIELIK